MPTDTTTLLALAVGAAILLWLGFSLLRRLFGLAILGALAFGAYMISTNPDLARHVLALAGLA